jgi:RNA polymerase sigma-70 factor (ECF subfamily)
MNAAAYGTPATPVAPVAAGMGRDGRAERAERAERDLRLAGLVQAAARGDSRAFEAFYDATFAYARTLARRVLRGAGEAAVEDLLADAYFEAWRHTARFDAARGSAVSWLLTIVRSRAIDALRSAAASPGAAGITGSAGSAADEADAPRGTASAADPAERLWRAEAGTRLHTALGGLAPGERWVLGLAYLREMSHAEIAAATGLPLGTVKSHALRAQRKLRVVLAGLNEA